MSYDLNEFGLNSALRPGSCVINPGFITDALILDSGGNDEGLTEAEQLKKAELYLSAKKIGVTVERLLEMRSYTAKLKKQFPHMKESRIQRKVAEYFKIKLT